MNSSSYVGRFAPSPSGPLHMGSLVAAMASYLDACAHGGAWLLRIEDLDFDRNVDGADQAILASLAGCGMQWDGEVEWQSRRQHLYEAAFERLQASIYPCACSRKEIADSRIRTGAGASALVYPGNCRNGLPAGRSARAWRLKVPLQPHLRIAFHDRWHGLQEQDVTAEVGDFVLRRADGFWAYQLAAVVDDAEQAVTHIVRGADLLDSTGRQIYLQTLLEVEQPSYLHVPVLTTPDGEKLSKQTGARAFDLGLSRQELLEQALLPAAGFLGLRLDTQPATLVQFWEAAVPAWWRLLQQGAESL
jgi:glutamyl-Q tRNA(Asp) synthetase